MGDFPAIQENAAGGGIQKPGNQVHCRGLSAAAFADDGKAFPGKQFKVNAIDSGKIRLPLPGEGFSQVFHP